MGLPLVPQCTPEACSPVGALVSQFSGEAIIASGTSVPTDATAGYSEGCLFIKENGAADAQVYINIGTAASCNFDPIVTSAILGLAATTAEINKSSDLSGQVLATEGGAGVVGDAETYATGIQEVGGIVITRILIDLTGLDSSGTAGDIIGDLAGGAAHIGQITTAKNGTLVGGTMQCLEVPTAGDPDVDIWAANEATGIFDDAIAGLTGEAQLINTGDWTLETDTMTSLPAADQYLYLTTGATDDATYTAGKFLITLYGVR